MNNLNKEFLRVFANLIGNVMKKGLFQDLGNCVTVDGYSNYTYNFFEFSVTSIGTTIYLIVLYFTMFGPRFGHDDLTFHIN